MRRCLNPFEDSRRSEVFWLLRVFQLYGHWYASDGHVVPSVWGAETRGDRREEWAFSYNLPTGAVYNIREKSVQARKRVKGVDGVPTTVTLTAVPMTFLARVSRVDLAPIQPDYHDYRKQGGNDGEEGVRLLVRLLIMTRCLTRIWCSPRLFRRKASRKRRYQRRVHWFQPWVTRCLFSRTGTWSFCSYSPARCNHGAASTRLRHGKWLSTAPKWRYSEWWFGSRRVRLDILARCSDGWTPKWVSLIQQSKRWRWKSCSKRKDSSVWPFGTGVRPALRLVQKKGSCTISPSCFLLGTLCWCVRMRRADIFDLTPRMVTRSCAESTWTATVLVCEDGHSVYLGVANNDEKRGGCTTRPQSDGDIVEIPPPSSEP